MAVHAKHRVVIAGGGFAALEAVLGIRRLAGERVRIDLVSAERELTYRPLAVIEPFGLGEAHRFDLAEIAADQGVSLHIDAVSSVEPERRVVRTGSGTEMVYDSLVMAIGARPERAVPGAFTYRGPPDGPECAGTSSASRLGSAQNRLRRPVRGHVAATAVRDRVDDRRAAHCGRRVRASGTRHGRAAPARHLRRQSERRGHRPVGRARHKGADFLRPGL